MAGHHFLQSGEAKLHYTFTLMSIATSHSSPRRQNRRSALPVLFVVLIACAPLSAQQNPPAAADQDKAAAEELAKAVQNPVASLISVPVQNNSNFNVGDFNRTQDVLNIQPVIPAKLNEKWNLITRIIQPIVWQPYPNQNAGGQYGLGDMNPTFFLSPHKPGKMIWGVGPAFVIPTATSTVLGQGKFSLGPSVRRPGSAGALDPGSAGQQRLVGRRLQQPSGGQSDAASVLRQLQHEEGLVYLDLADPHRRLGGEQRQ